LKSEDEDRYPNSPELGNKILCNVGLLKMFGIPRSHKMSRLHRNANKGETEILVAPGLDWKEGNRIALLATSLKHDGAEENHIVSYNNETGAAVVRDPIVYHHFGKAESTAEYYAGVVDIRGEVLLLSRNVRIVGDDKQSWGGALSVRDSVEIDMATGDIIERKG